MKNPRFCHPNPLCFHRYKGYFKFIARQYCWRIQLILPVVHLIGAVKDYDVFGEGLAHILHCLRLAGASWPTRGASHTHRQRLRQRYVASVNQTSSALVNL